MPNSNNLGYFKASGAPLTKLTGAATASAATAVFWTGFEYGVLSMQGAGLFNTIDNNGTATTISSAQANTGAYSLRTAPTTALASRAIRLIAGTPTVMVARHYFKIVTAPTSAAYIAEMDASVSAANPRIYLNPTGTAIELRCGSTFVVAIGTYTLNTWFYVDWKADMSANPWVLTGSVNGGADATANFAQAADTFTAYRMGTGSTTGPAFDVYHDDVLISVTSGDYPLGAGGTEVIVPMSDGTHNAGANIMEANGGADIGVTPAWSLVDDVPISSTVDYIQQAAAGTTNYAEVNFTDPTHNTQVYGVRAILAYMSAGTSSNQGATIVSNDNFATFEELFGNPTTRADMSEASLFYKTLFMTEPGGGWDSTTLNALKARMGYSGDASPIPQWHAIMMEIAYSLAVGTTYNKTGGATIVSSAGGGKSLIFSETVSSRLVGVGSGVDADIFAETGIAIVVSSANGADVNTFAELGTAVFIGIGSGADIYSPSSGNIYIKTGGALSIARGSGADITTFSESGIATTILSSTSVDNATYTETGGARSIFTASGVDASTFADAGTAVSIAKASGVDISTFTETGYAESIFTASGVDADTFTETGLGRLSGVGGGVSSTAGTYLKTGSAAIVARASGGDASTRARAGGAVSVSRASGTDAATFNKTGYAVTVFVSTGSDVSTFSETGSGVSPWVGNGAKSLVFSKAGAGVLVVVGFGAKEIGEDETEIVIVPLTLFSRRTTLSLENRKTALSVSNHVTEFTLEEA